MLSLCEVDSRGCTDPQPSPIPPYVPPKRRKYDDLVDVLVDGLFEMVLNDDAPFPQGAAPGNPGTRVSQAPRRTGTRV